MTTEELIWQAVDEHILLLEQLGYYLEIKDNIQLDEEMPIYKNDKVVGKITVEEKNMYYLHEKNKIVGNRDLNLINFSRRKSKNMRTLFHTVIKDNNLVINNYNMLLSSERQFIAFTDNKNFIAKKILNDDEVKVESLISDIDNQSIINYLKRPVKKQGLTYKLGEV